MRAENLRNGIILLKLIFDIGLVPKEKKIEKHQHIRLNVALNIEKQWTNKKQMRKCFRQYFSEDDFKQQNYRRHRLIKQLGNRKRNRLHNLYLLYSVCIRFSMIWVKVYTKALLNIHFSSEHHHHYELIPLFFSLFLRIFT